MCSKNINLTYLLYSLYYTKCNDVSHHHNPDDQCEIVRIYITKLAEYIFNILETKQEKDFLFKKVEKYTDTSTIRDFSNSNIYICDENTTAWIIYYGLDDRTRKIICCLASQGITAKSNPETMHSILYNFPDNEICWLINYAKLPLDVSCYYWYGIRRDRTILQKKMMFEMFYKYLSNPGPNIITYCYYFSDNYKCIIKMIKWFLARGVKPGETDLVGSFNLFGTRLFPSLYNLGFRPRHLDPIIFSNRNIGEKIDAISWINEKMPIANMAGNIFEMGIISGELEICRHMLVLGVRPTVKSLEFLFMKRFVIANNPETKYSREYITACINLVLNNTDLEIPHTGPEARQYFERENYRFDGFIYDWLVSTHKKMANSQEIWERNNEILKKNGQCKYFAKNGKDTECFNWPNCKYYHGKLN